MNNMNKLERGAYMDRQWQRKINTCASVIHVTIYLWTFSHL